MKSPGVAPSVPKPEETQSITALESALIIIEDLHGKLTEALSTDNFQAQRELTEKLQSELDKAKKIQRKLEGKETILSVDRTINLVDFLKKPESEGGLDIKWLDPTNPIAESDPNNEGLTEIDLTKVSLDTSWLPEGKTYIKGEARLTALKSKDSTQTRLDLYVFASLWKLYKTDPTSFEEKMKIIAETSSITIEDLKKKLLFFDGTIVRGSDGERRALYLSWDGSSWVWDSRGLLNEWNDDSPSLVLARH